MGSYYIYPELIPKTLEGEVGPKVDMNPLFNYYNRGFRAVDVTVPYPVTDKGHCVIVTGDKSATPETLEYAKSTLMDSLRHEGYLCIGIMQKGDFYQMRNKFDIIIYDQKNSINCAEILISRKNKSEISAITDYNIVEEINEIMDSKKDQIKSYVSSKNISDKYCGYNKWAIDTAQAVVSLMANYPNQKYIIVINAGAVDTAGHYRGYAPYVECVGRICEDVVPLLEQCFTENIGFVMTADHGMTFTNTVSKSGGHSSTKYSSAPTSLKIPFIVWADNVKKSTYLAPAGQENITPTLLSLTESEELPRFMNAKPLPLKEKVSLTVKLSRPDNIFIYDPNTQESIYRSTAPDNIFKLRGFDTGTYEINFENNTENRTLLLETDTVYDETIQEDDIESSGGQELSDCLSNMNHNIKHIKQKVPYLGLIALINIIGFGFIYHIYKKKL